MDGTPGAKRSLLLDSRDFVLSLSSTGVSVARNHLFASMGRLVGTANSYLAKAAS